MHNLVLEAFVGPRPSPTHQAAHRDGNKLNNRLDNLYWATPKENGADNARLRVGPRGERHPHAKLDNVSVQKIRRATGTRKQIAALFGVSPATVTNVRTRRGWVHVP